jgi:hypothetical protein
MRPFGQAEIDPRKTVGGCFPQYTLDLTSTLTMDFREVRVSPRRYWDLASDGA